MLAVADIRGVSPPLPSCPHCVSPDVVEDLFCCCFIVTLSAQVSYTFMKCRHMLWKTLLCCCFIVTLSAWVMGILLLHELPPHVVEDLTCMTFYSCIQCMGILHLHELIYYAGICEYIFYYISCIGIFCQTSYHE